MDIICIDEIKTLIKRSPGLHVSIFLPTRRASGGADPEGPIRLKNLIRQAEEKMTRAGLRGAEARVMLEPVQKLLQDNLFWRQQSEGLAIFLHDNQYLIYQVPTKVEEMVVVTDRFHIKPLLTLLGGCAWYYVLALSQNEIRLLECTEFTSIRVKLEGVPRNLAEATAYEVPDSRESMHAGATRGGSKGEYAVFQGEGPASNYNEKNILIFFDQVNKGVHKILKEEKAPLVLAGVEYLLPLYRKANSYHTLLAEGINGNPEKISDDNLREQAWKIVQPYFDKTRKEATAQFKQSAGTGVTSTDIKEVVLNAFNGRVRFLFVAKGTQQWGSFDPGTRDVVLASGAEQGDEDLLDLAAFETLAHGGTVYIMEREEVPGKNVLSALLRY